MNDKTLEPEISLSGLGAAIGIAGLSLKGGHITKKKSRELIFETSYCKTCRNIDASISSKESHHLEMQSNSRTELVIIPHGLSVFLKDINFHHEELALRIQDLKTSLDGIYRKWQKVGSNPCKCNKVGRKLMFELKKGIIITCWIIIDSIGNKIVFRLSYGGGNVQCP